MEKLSKRQHDELIEAVKTIVCFSKRKALTNEQKAEVDWMLKELKGGK
jgi:hypothetical protein